MLAETSKIWKKANEYLQERKMVHSLLNVSNAKRFVPYQTLENKQMLNDILDTPDDILKHIR